jgi:hypothetical protein
MHHDRAHAVVARLLTDPAALATISALHRDPGSSSVDRSPPTLDEFTAVELAKLRLFQGFITKIKHNPLLPILPLTFKALRKFGVEIEFFAQHSPKFLEARTQGPLPLQTQMTLAADALRATFIDRPFHPYLCALLQHELTIWQVGQTTDPPLLANRPASVRWQGKFVLQRYQFDIGSIDRLALEAGPGGCEPNPSPKTFAYWRPDTAASVSVFEVDDATAVMLAFVDGARDLNEIRDCVLRTGLFAPTYEDIRAFFDDASQHGFVSFDAS